MRWNDRIGRRLKLADLHVLVAVAQHGSMAKAAAALSMSHPVVSRSISDLEHILGVRLLERRPRGVELTAFGYAILKRSLAAFDELRSGVQDIAFLADPTAGEVRVGTTSGLGGNFLAAVIDRVSRRHPRIVCHVVTGDSRALYRHLEERDVDLLIARVFEPTLTNNVDVETLCEDPYVVATGTRNPWARRRYVSLSDVVKEAWALPPADSLVGAFVVEAFRRSGLSYPRTAVVGFPVELRNCLIVTGRYMTILPRSMISLPGKHPLIKELPIKLPNANGPIGVFTLRTRELTPATKLFIDGARDIAKSMAKETR